MNSIISLDEQLLLWINSFHNEHLDTIMWIISAKTTWIPLYIIIVALLFYRYRKQYKLFFILFLTFIIAVGCSDIVANFFIKQNVCRLRPTHNDTIAHLIHIVNGYRGGLYGFVSNHAANTMTLALLFSLIWKTRIITIIMMIWVILNCYSRIYLGVHYPLDILGGLCVGTGIALFFYYVVIPIVVSFARHHDDKDVLNCKYGANN